MLTFIEHIMGYVVKIINELGYLGIAGGMFLESACIPLPSEVVLPLGGFMVAGGTISMLGANIAVAVGSMAGSLLAYLVGYYGGRPFILKYGKYFFVSEKHFYESEKTFRKYGSAAVFFGRLLPVIRTFISLPAGIARMDIKKFLVFSLVGMLPWNFILIFLGYKFGQQYEKVIRPIFHRFEYAVIGVFVLIIAFFIVKHFSGKKRKTA
mgnify:CR=1 FL=1